MQRQGSTRSANAVGFLYWAGWQAVVPFIALYATGLGASPAAVGLILGGYHIVALILSVPTGVLAEHVGSGRMMFAGCLLGAIGPLMIISGGGLFALTAGLVVIGLAQIMVSIGTQVETILGATQQTVIRAMGVYFFFSSASQVVGPGLGAWLVGGTNYGMAFVGAAVLSALGLLASINPARRPPARMVARPPAIESIVSTLRDKPATRAALLVTLTGDLVMAFWNTFFPLLLIVRGYGPEAIAIFFSLRAVSNTAVRPFIGLFTSHAWRTQSIILSLVTVAVSLALMPVLTSQLGMGLAVVVFGFAGGLSFTIVAAALAAGFSVEAAGLGMGMRMLMSRIGIILGPVVLGVVVQSLGFTAAFFAGAAILGASALPYLARPSALRAASQRSVASGDDAAH
ncbi:MAG: MFS transporter [Armatimonadota bacterium]